MRRVGSPLDSVTVATVCVMLSGLQGCSGEMNAASRDRLGNEPGASSDGVTVEASTKAAPDRKGQRRGPGAGSEKSGLGEPNASGSGGTLSRGVAGKEPAAAMPTNVAGAFLVQPELRTCLKDSKTKIGADDDDDSAAGIRQEVVGLCGLEFVAQPTKMPKSEPTGLQLTGSGQETDLFRPVRTANGAIGSVLVMAESPEDAIKKVTSRVHPRDVRIFSDLSSLEAERQAALTISSNRWIIYSKATTIFGTVRLLNKWQVDLEVAPVTFSTMDSAKLLSRLISGEAEFQEVLMLLFAGGKLMLVEKDPKSGTTTPVADWPGNELVKLGTSLVIRRELSLIAQSLVNTSFQILFDRPEDAP